MKNKNEPDNALIRPGGQVVISDNGFGGGKRRKKKPERYKELEEKDLT